MKLESLEKLRKYELFDRGIQVSAYMPSDELADEIQAEVDERYMPLPLDADGVPIRPGDQMTDGSQRADGRGLAKWDVVSVNERAFFDMSGGAHVPIEHRHVKPRTVEDVLHDFGNDYAAFLSGIYPFENARQCEVIAKYAAEIRELLGVVK